MRMPKVDGLAIAALVLGIVSGSTGSAASWPSSSGAVAIERINASNGWITGKGMAAAGLVLGIIGVSTFALLFLIGMASMAWKKDWRIRNALIGSSICNLRIRHRRHHPDH